MKLSEALTQLGHPVAYYPTLCRVFGMEESVFIAQLVYWTGKQADADGWIYKTSDEMREETGLSYEQQRRIRRKLMGDSIGSKNRRIVNRLIEAVLEEKYDHHTHKMYFRICMDALDRIFSQGQLFSTDGLSGGVYGHSPTTTRTMSMSSIQRLQHKTTSTSALKKAHKEYVEWWERMCVQIRGKRPKWSPADFRNLKLALKWATQSRLEQLGLYFLANPKFEKYDSSLHVFLSEGIMRGLKSAQNKEGFWHSVDEYAGKYYRILHAPEETAREESMEVIINNLVAKFAIKK